MGESRAIWRQVLEDILRIIPSPDIRRRIQNMSAADLRAQAILAVRMDNLWNRTDEIHPKTVRCFPCPSDVVRAELGPGGRWILTQHLDGTLKLWDPNMLDPPLAVAAPHRIEGATRREPIPHFMGLLLAASDEGQFAITIDRHTSPEQVNWLLDYSMY